MQSLVALGVLGSVKPIKALSETLTEDGNIMPVLFIGHGNPMNAIEENEFSLRWRKMGTEIPKPKAIICISAHWLTRGTYVTAMENPRTIHDFGGFGQELFDVRYNAPGDKVLAKETQGLITSTNVELDHDWGLDHGCWSVINQMYPEADIPTIQLSIDYHRSGNHHYELGQELKALRKKGVLIIGSGNMVHNLRMATASVKEGFDWAMEINETFKEHILNENHQALINYQKLGKAAEYAIPTPDHYYPLLYTLGLQSKGEKMSIFNDKCLAGSLSMTSVRIG